ncbi:MAG: hypothetical protein NTX88_01920 [Candidatus Atribacteria bacterium]|nr:hypothetical protein [Candidatus Atribacteria bacterium]
MYYSSRFSAWFISVLLVFLALSFSGNLFAEESNPAFLITVESIPVRPGEPIIVEFTSGPGNPKDWIGLYKSGAPDRDYREWQYLNGLSQGSLTFKPVDEEGEFQFRGFANDGMTLLGKSDIFEVKKISVQVTNWETKTVGNVTLSIPQNWQTTPPN